MIMWFGWVKVAIRNFPNYSFGRTSAGKFIVFYRTGHCLHLANPLGLQMRGKGV